MEDLLSSSARCLPWPRPAVLTQAIAAGAISVAPAREAEHPWGPEPDTEAREVKRIHLQVSGGQPMDGRLRPRCPAAAEATTGAGVAADRSVSTLKSPCILKELFWPMDATASARTAAAAPAVAFL